MKPLAVTACALALALFPLGAGAAEGEETEDNKIRTIVKRGERVELEGYLVTGKYTLFEFYADWSAEWQKMAPEVEAKVKNGDDVVLRRINVRSWSSPVAQQYGITALPHYKLYDPSGKLMKAYSPEGAERGEPAPPGKERKKHAARGSAGSSGPSEVQVPKVLTICAQGERVDLTQHLVKGRHTLFEFYADW